MKRIVIVIPCYNEAERLDTSAIAEWLARRDDVTVLFVNDGSKDRTLFVLEGLRQRNLEQVEVLDLGKNQGKAEAVRRGLLRGLELQPTYVGYFDADLATPLAELERLIGIATDTETQVLLASRVALLGRQIERSLRRHYLGRVFATMASIILRLRVYDTQCGAKLLRCTSALETALREPFLSRWAFDVELIGRLLNPPPNTPPLQASDIVEEPLLVWRDVPGSKLTASHMLRSALDLLTIDQELRRARAAMQRRGA